jgi:hypothetical protein
VGCSFVIGASWTDVVITLAVIALGIAVGSIVGTAFSPYDKQERARFASYGRLLVVFFTGYLASKLDGFITTALSPETLGNLSSLQVFRLVVFNHGTHDRESDICIPLLRRS